MIETEVGFVKENMPKRQKDANKGSVGSLVSVCGSYGMAGASILAGKGALRSGVGLLKIALCKSIYPIVTLAIPEAVCMPLSEEEGHFSENSLKEILDFSKKSTAVLFGCGVGVSEGTTEILKGLIRNIKVPLIIDADGLNCLAKNIDIIKEANTSIVLTPHPGEMSRLTRLSVRDIQKDRENICKNFSKKYGVITLLKGHRTVISNGEDVFVNPTGNPGMATGGSGDVLSGIIGALISQGVSPFCGAVMGAYIHGLSGDICKENLGEISMTPSDLAEALPKAFLKIME